MSVHLCDICKGKKRVGTSLRTGDWILSAHKPAESLTLAVFFLLVSTFQALEGLDVLNGFKCFVEIIYNVSYEGLDVLLHSEDSGTSQTQKRATTRRPEPLWVSTHHFNELKELYDGRVEEVVSSAVVQERVDDRLKQVSFDDVAVVVLVLQTNDSAHETQSTWDKQTTGSDMRPSEGADGLSGSG